MQQFLTVKVPSTILWEKGVTIFLLSQMDLSGSVCPHYQCFKCWDLSFIIFLESVYFTLVDLEKLNFEYVRQHLKLRNLDFFYVWSESESRSVVSNSLRPHGLYSPWNFPAQNTGVWSLSLLQGIFPTQELNWGLLHCRQILYQLSYQRSRLGRGDIRMHSLPVCICLCCQP